MLVYILGQAHYSKSLIYVQKCKNLDLDPELDFRKKVRPKVGFLEQCGSSYVKVTIISVSSFMNKMSSCLVSTREKHRSMLTKNRENFIASRYSQHHVVPPIHFKG